MALPPLTITSNPTSLSDAEAIMLQPDNISVTIRNGIRTIEGFNKNGEKVVIETIISNSNPSINNGFKQQNMSVCDKLSPSERKNIAIQLKQEKKLTQAEIAKKLGVSQKTISNDLNS